LKIKLVDIVVLQHVSSVCLTESTAIPTTFTTESQTTAAVPSVSTIYAITTVPLTAITGTFCLYFDGFIIFHICILSRKLHL